MQSQNHSAVIGAGYMSRIAKLPAGAGPTKHLKIARSKRHSIQDARKAVADKLQANLAYLRDLDSCERPDLVYKEQGPGMYVLGVKYGNRWLKGLFNGDSYLQGLSADYLAELLEGFAADALAGQFDAFILPIMADNVDARNSVKH